MAEELSQLLNFAGIPFGLHYISLLFLFFDKIKMHLMPLLRKPRANFSNCVQKLNKFGGLIIPKGNKQRNNIANCNASCKK